MSEAQPGLHLHSKRRLPDRLCRVQSDQGIGAVDLVGEAYRQLSPHVRLRLLRTFVATLENAPDSLDVLHCGPTIRDKIEACLETIAVLADENASTLVKLALSDHGLDGDRFAAFASRHDRTAELWIRKPDHAKQVLSWLHANVEIRRGAHTEAFQTPIIDHLALPDAEGEQRLLRLIEKVLADALQASDVRALKLSRRPSPWSGEAASDLIQIDIKRSLDPEKVEIDEDGTVLVKSLRFIAAIVVVIDPTRRVIYVLSRQNPRKLRQGLAMAIMQHFFGQGAEPFKIPKALVHPGKLAQRPDFDLVRPDIISDVTVCELDYRVIGESGVRRSAICEKHGADLYALRDFADPTAGREVYRAGLRFQFIGRDGEEHGKTAFIEHPNRLTLAYFNQREQPAAEQFLIRNGLLDPSPYQGQAGPLDLLAEVASDMHVTRIETALGRKWMGALKASGVLTSGTLAEDIYCDACNRLHTLERDPVQLDEWITACPVSPSPVLQRDRQTLRFRPSRLARWLADALGTDVAQPSEIHPGIWDLGVTPSAGKKGQISLFLVTTLADDKRLKAIADRVGLIATRPRGLILSVSSRHLGLRLANGWMIAALSGLIDADCGKLKVAKDGLSFLMSGKQARKTATRKLRWPELFAAYESIRHLGLGTHLAADRLLEMPGKNWPWERDTIAKALKRKFPGDFPDG